MITGNSKMEKLSMRNNDIKLKGLLIICKGLRKLSTLKQLDIENCLITEEAADEIAAGIACNPLLSNIYLESNV